MTFCGSWITSLWLKQRWRHNLLQQWYFWLVLFIGDFCLKSLFAAAAVVKLLQSCSTLCDPIDGSPPGSAVPGILQARTLEWVAISFSNVCTGVGCHCLLRKSLVVGANSSLLWTGLRVLNCRIAITLFELTAINVDCIKFGFHKLFQDKSSSQGPDCSKGKNNNWKK